MVDGNSHAVRNMDRIWFDRSNWGRRMQNGFDHIKNFRETKKHFKKRRKHITDAFLILERRVFLEDAVYDLQLRRAKRIILDWWLRKRHYLKSKRTYYLRDEIESKPRVGVKFQEYENYVDSVAN